jgi:hypothetical protein
MEAGLKPDKEINDFITEVIDSLVMWELLAFLWHNPGLTDKADGVAGRLGRRREDVAPALHALAKNEILEKWGADDDPVYSFRPSGKQSKALEKFMAFNQDKEGKLWIWTQLLHKGLR